MAIETALVCNRCKAIFLAGQVLDFKMARDRAHAFGWVTGDMRTDFCPECKNSIRQAKKRHAKFVVQSVCAKYLGHMERLNMVNLSESEKQFYRDQLRLMREALKDNQAQLAPDYFEAAKNKLLELEIDLEDLLKLSWASSPGD